MIRAAIDIGTNSVKLVIADVEGDKNPSDADIVTLYEKSTQTRLGRGLYQSGEISKEAQLDTLDVLESFVEKSRIFDAKAVRIVATSAMREASNGHEFATRIQREIGIPVEIISGDREAEMSFLGVATQIRNHSRPVLLIDVGGGSTELVVGQNNKVTSFCSLQLGSVRCTEKLNVGDPPSKDDFKQAKQLIKDSLHASPGCLAALKSAPIKRAISTGGTAAAMVGMILKKNKLDRDEIDKMSLSLNDVSEVRRKIWCVSLSERREIPGIPAKKADILIMGVLIHEVVFKMFGVEVCQSSTRGVRYGALFGDPQKT